jgi:hypothetical protein
VAEQTKHYLNTHVPHCAVMDVHVFYEENKELATEHNFQEKETDCIVKLEIHCNCLFRFPEQSISLFV